MNSYRNWLQRLPLPLLFVFLFLLWTALHIVIRSGNLDRVELIGDILGGLVFSGLLTVVIAARRRRMGGREQLVEYQNSVRSGRLPEHVDASRWDDALDRDHRISVRSRWLIPVLVVVPIAAGVLLIGLSPDAWPEATLLIVLFAGLAVVGVVQAERQRKRIESLSDQLHGRSNLPTTPST